MLPQEGPDIDLPDPSRKDYREDFTLVNMPIKAVMKKRDIGKIGDSDIVILVKRYTIDSLEQRIIYLKSHKSLMIPSCHIKYE